MHKDKNGQMIFVMDILTDIHDRHYQVYFIGKNHISVICDETNKSLAIAKKDVKKYEIAA